MSEYEIFVKDKDLKTIKSSKNSASALARALTRAVFTEAALEVCSVSGKVSVGRSQPERRTALDPNGVDAIIGNY